MPRMQTPFVADLRRPIFTIHRTENTAKITMRAGQRMATALHQANPLPQERFVAR
jgi:hypothetical protein